MNIFLSHITEESPIATELKKCIKSTFGLGCKVFVSSDLESIPAGSSWLEEIDKALDASEALLILCSPASLSSPWINFEAGCGYIKRIPIIPICHSGLEKSSLPDPVAMFQALEIEQNNFASSLFGSLAKHLKVKKPQTDQKKMARALKRALQLVKLVNIIPLHIREEVPRISEQAKSAREIWALFTTGRDIVNRYGPLLRNKCKAGCKLRVLSAREDSDVLDMWRDWYEGPNNKKSSDRNIKAEAKKTRRLIESLPKAVVKRKCLNDYIPFTMFATNPKNADGEIVVGFQNYRGFAGDRPYIHIKATDNSPWYKYFLDQYEEMWKYADKAEWQS
jgi:TIR domain-containing protein